MDEDAKSSNYSPPDICCHEGMQCFGLPQKLRIQILYEISTFLKLDN